MPWPSPTTTGYAPGLLALREGPLLEAGVQSLPLAPEVLIVGATVCDHPRRAGLALHPGARLEVPTIAVTDRPLLASGAWPPDEPGSAPLVSKTNSSGAGFAPDAQCGLSRFTRMAHRPQDSRLRRPVGHEKVADA
jgi:deoxyinosine 3'endonuclease (endonuclease V)